MNKIRLSIVIPCHNAATTITATLTRVIRDTHSFGQVEIIVIENGSTDESLEILHKFQKSSPFGSQIQVYTSKKGLGNAIRAGISRSIGENIVLVADDLPFGMQEINYCMTEFIHNNEYIIFSKYKSQRAVGQRPMRNLLGFGFVILRELMLKTRVFDSQGTFCGTSNTIKSIFELSAENEFAITTEAILIAKNLKLQVKEIPVTKLEPKIRPSTLRFSDMKNMVQSLNRLRKKYKA